MKKIVYLDSTIPNYLYDQRDSIRNFIDITNQWWQEERENYHLVSSEAMLVELSRGEYPHKERILEECLPLVEILPFDQRIDEIVEVYETNYLMPKASMGDGTHLAYASLYKSDFLLTWNCNHIANANKMHHIRVINTRLGLFVPEIITPLELFKETDS